MKKLNELLTKLNAIVNGSSSEEQENICKELWKQAYRYVVDCATTSPEKLINILDNDYDIPKEKYMAELFEVTEREFHREIKEQIRELFYEHLKVNKIHNFTIGYHRSSKLIVIKPDKKDNLLIITNKTINDYSHE